MMNDELLNALFSKIEAEAEENDLAYEFDQFRKLLSTYLGKAIILTREDERTRVIHLIDARLKVLEKEKPRNSDPYSYDEVSRRYEERISALTLLMQQVGVESRTAFDPMSSDRHIRDASRERLKKLQIPMSDENLKKLEELQKELNEDE